MNDEEKLKDLEQRIERIELVFQMAADQQAEESKRGLHRSIRERREMWRKQPRPKGLPVE